MSLLRNHPRKGKPIVRLGRKAGTKSWNGDFTVDVRQATEGIHVSHEANAALRDDSHHLCFIVRHWHRELQAQLRRKTTLTEVLGESSRAT